MSDERYLPSDPYRRKKKHISRKQRRRKKMRHFFRCIAILLRYLGKYIVLAAALLGLMCLVGMFMNHSFQKDAFSDGDSKSIQGAIQSEGEILDDDENTGTTSSGSGLYAEKGNTQNSQSEEEYISVDITDLEGEYQEDLLELLEKNPETREYVASYSEKKGTYELSPLEEYKNCREVPLLLQWDERWGYYEYGDGLMGWTGCGPTCLSMVAIYLLHDTEMTPLWMANYSLQNGYCVSGSGTAWGLMSDGARALGLSVRELPLNERTIAEYLQAGNPIICSMGPGDFTDNGHFIVLTDWEDGMVTINDPNSEINSSKQWAFEDIKGQIKNLWGYQ